MPCTVIAVPPWLTPPFSFSLVQPYSGRKATLYTTDGGRTWQHRYDGTEDVHRTEVVDQETWLAALEEGTLEEGDTTAFVGTHDPDGDGQGDLKEFIEKFAEHNVTLLHVIFDDGVNGTATHVEVDLASDPPRWAEAAAADDGGGGDANDANATYNATYVNSYTPMAFLASLLGGGGNATNGTFSGGPGRPYLVREDEKYCGTTIASQRATPPNPLEIGARYPAPEGPHQEHIAFRSWHAGESVGHCVAECEDSRPCEALSSYTTSLGRHGCGVLTGLTPAAPPHQDKMYVCLCRRDNIWRQCLQGNTGHNVDGGTRWVPRAKRSRHEPHEPRTMMYTALAQDEDPAPCPEGEWGEGVWEGIHDCQACDPCTGGAGFEGTVEVDPDPPHAVTGVTVVNGGAGYRETHDDIAFAAPTGSGAVGTLVAHPTSGKVLAVAISEGGTGYTPAFCWDLDELAPRPEHTTREACEDPTNVDLAWNRAYIWRTADVLATVGAGYYWAEACGGTRPGKCMPSGRGNVEEMYETFGIDPNLPFRAPRKDGNFSDGIHPDGAVAARTPPAGLPYLEGEGPFDYPEYGEHNEDTFNRDGDGDGDGEG